MNDIDCVGAIYTHERDWQFDLGVHFHEFKLAHGKYVILGIDEVTLVYFHNGKEHREDGPSKVSAGTINSSRFDQISYSKHGLLNRENGPALYLFNGQSYYANGEYFGNSVAGKFVPAQKYTRCKTFKEALKIYKMNKVLER